MFKCINYVYFSYPLLYKLLGSRSQKNNFQSINLIKKLLHLKKLIKYLYEK